MIVVKCGGEVAAEPVCADVAGLAGNVNVDADQVASAVAAALGGAGTTLEIE
jgi:hypothetical protein